MLCEKGINLRLLYLNPFIWSIQVHIKCFDEFKQDIINYVVKTAVINSNHAKLINR